MNIIFMTNLFWPGIYNDQDRALCRDRLSDSAYLVPVQHCAFQDFVNAACHHDRAVNVFGLVTESGLFRSDP